MESEAITQKRTAQELRYLNQQYDKKVINETFTKDKKVQELKKAIQTQRTHRKEDIIQKKVTDRSVPDIAGEHGYPSLPKPTV